MSLKNFFVLFLKGMGMGIANVIPGVSGGTITSLSSGVHTCGGTMGAGSSCTAQTIVESVVD